MMCQRRYPAHYSALECRTWLCGTLVMGYARGLTSPRGLIGSRPVLSTRIHIQCSAPTVRTYGTMGRFVCAAYIFMMAKPTRVNVRSERRGPKRTLHAPCAQGVRESVKKR
eukprot:5094079-Prymnesium_polylepis.2